MKRHSIAIPSAIPDGVRCVPVFIPDDDAYAQMLLDAIAALTQQRSYERDDNKTGKVIAELWSQKTIAPLLISMQNMESCAGMFNCDDFENCAETSLTISTIINKQSQQETAIDAIFQTTGASTINVNTYKITENTTINNAIETPVPNTPANPDLCLESMWSGSLSMAQMIHDANVDFLELVNSYALNTAKRYASLVSAIPVLGTLADAASVTKVMELAALVVETFYAGYIGVVTDDTIKETACYIYGQHCENCSVPTYKDLLDYHGSFLQDLNIDIAVMAIMDIISIFITGTFTTPLVYHAMSYLQLVMLLAEQEFLGRKGTKWLQIAYNVGANSPDADYLLWCDPCSEPVDLTPFQYDYRAAQGTSIVGGTGGSTYGTYAVGGYRYYNGSFWERLWVKQTGLPNLTISKILLYQLRSDQNGYINPAVTINLLGSNGTIINTKTSRWDTVVLDENNVPYRQYTYNVPVSGVYGVEIRFSSLNNATVGTWRFYGWGYA